MPWLGMGVRLGRSLRLVLVGKLASPTSKKQYFASFDFPVLE